MGICTISYASAVDDSGLISGSETQIIEEAAPEEDVNINLDSLEQEEVLTSDGSIYHITSDDDIQQTVDAANAGDTILLNGTFKVENLVTINKPLNISGTDKGASIIFDSAVKKPGIFNITSEASNVILNNLKFISGISNGCGGAVTWFGDNGSITNCEFSKNIAGGSYGGSLVLAGNNCNVTNSTFNKNTANRYGGAIVINGDNCNLIGCTFTENKASLYGGAVVVNGRGSQISKCEFEKNEVSSSLNGSSITGGGAIYAVCDDFIIDNAIFTNNRAIASYGGAIRLDKHSIVKNSNFNDNLAYLGNDIYSNSYSNIMYNTFIIEYNETETQSVYGENLIKVNNTFIKNKIDSSITFVSTGIVFDYGRSGTIYVNVKGGTIGTVKVLNHPEAKISIDKNAVTVSNLAVGSYTLRVTTSPDADHNSVSSDLSIKVNKATAAIKASKITVALKKGTSWTIKLVDSKTGKGIANMKVTLKIYTGKKFKTVNVKTNSKGVASYKTSSLTKGSHKVVVSASHKGYNFKTLTSSIKVVKPKKLTYKVSKITLKDGSTIMFKVFDKKTKKPLNGISFKLKIYNGNKVVKTISLKSKTLKKNKGVLGYTTNQLTVGSHKVVLVPASVKYDGFKKSSIKITKKQKKYPDYSSKL